MIEEGNQVNWEL